MILRFSNLREPDRIDVLSPLHRRQLAVCARLYFGDETPLTRRLGGEEDDPGASFRFVELWDVEADGAHRFDVFLYNVDSGAVFRRGTTEVVAERIQCHFDHGEDKTLLAALQAGYHAACAARRGVVQAAMMRRPANARPARAAATRR